MSRAKLFPEEEVVRVTLRLPVSLKNKVEQLALANHRSSTQEVVTLLEEAIQMRAKRLPLTEEQPPHPE